MSNYYLGPDGELYATDELKHYGVRGMKWGVRRYQNADGTLTPEGRKKAKREYKIDNARAFERGKNAAIAGRALAKSMKRTAKLEERADKQYLKDPDGETAKSKRINEKLSASQKTTDQLRGEYEKNKVLAEEHCKSLVEKYGKEAVSSIKYKDIKAPTSPGDKSKMSVVNERTNKLSTYAAAGAISVASVAFNAVGATPLAVLMFPKSARSKGAEAEAYRYYDNLSKVKRGK